MRLEDGMNQDGVEFPGRNSEALAPNDGDDDGVALGVVVPANCVRLAWRERKRAEIEEERTLVQRFGHAGLLFAIPHVRLAVRVELILLVLVFAIGDLLYVP